jgi:hypothetical protein
MFPFPDQFGQPVVVGFSGMSELDYMATHLASAMISSSEYDTLSEDGIIDSAVRMALRLQAKCNEINQRANQPQQEEQQAQKPIILES